MNQNFIKFPYMKKKSKNLLSAFEDDQDFDNLRHQLSIANTILIRIKRSQVVKEYSGKLETLRMEVESVKIPTLVSVFSAFFDKLSEMAKVLTDRSQEFSEMDDLLIDLSDLRSLVEYFKEDNDIKIGWTSTSVILAGISVGTAFIPVIGWGGVTAALNMAPVVGRLVHNSVVRNKRSKGEYLTKKPKAIGENLLHNYLTQKKPKAIGENLLHNYLTQKKPKAIGENLLQNYLTQ
ncbi:hypothetical protein Btru_049891 [Bulinus truncatus]|nr:hypothetical protein Btru_049891 [Bulinus truncatus]